MANEAETAEAFVRETLRQFDSFGSVTLFTIFDNACRDGTRVLLERLAKNERRLKVVWAPENRGIVDAYVRGYREALSAGCEWILEIDAGFSHKPTDIPKFIECMRQDYDCVFGTRFARGGSIAGSSRIRYVISRFGGLLSAVILGSKLTDMTSGFQMFRREALETILREGIRSRGPFFQTEMKFHCRRMRWAEVPISYSAASHHVRGAAIRDALKNLFRLAVRRA